MPRIDLSTPSGFSTATSGILSDARSLADFNLDQKLWQIKEASFIPAKGSPIVFHTFQSIKPYIGSLQNVTDTIGRRKQVYKLPYVDGQTTDDLGRDGGTFVFAVMIHGTKYKQGLAEINRLINQATPGSLIHPVQGEIKAVIKDVEFLHEASSRNAVMLKLVFLEHSYGLLGLQAEKKNTVLDSISSALSSALENVNRVNQVIANVTAAAIFAQTLKSSIIAKLQSYSSNYALLLSALNLTFNSQGARSLPDIVPVQQGGNLNADGSIEQSPTAVAASINSQTDTVETGQTIAAVAALESVNKANAVRDQIQDIINDLSQGDGSLVFYDDILALKQSAIDMQKAVESAIASSNALVFNYTVPRLMTIREVAFANGLSVDRVDELALLNRELPSANYIDAGTIVVVPVA